MKNIKSISLLLAIMLVMTLGAIPTTAKPTATTNDAADGGQITEVDFTDVVSDTTKWQGYYGNVTSAANGIVLKDTNTMYQWSYTPSLLAGTVFATQSSTMSTADWLSLNASDEADLDAAYSFTTTSADSATNTFSSSKTLNVSGRSTSGPYVATNVNNTANTTTWYTVALNKTAYGSESDFVFAGIINNNATAYDNTTKDYQIIVPVNGTTQTYYFYVELK